MSDETPKSIETADDDNVLMTTRDSVGTYASRASQLFAVGAVAGAIAVPLVMRQYNVNLDHSVTVVAVFSGAMYLTLFTLPRVLALIMPAPEPETKTIKLAPRVVPIAVLTVIAGCLVLIGIAFALSAIAYGMLGLIWATTAALNYLALAMTLAMGLIILAILYLLMLLAIQHRDRLTGEFRKVFIQIETSCRVSLNIHGGKHSAAQ